MNNLNDALNWKLLSGSHDFPGPSGGTCINEAAIVVAGFPYRSVSSPSDCPPCFSKVMSRYLINLNDRMPDDQRQRLLPFAVKLSGSADTFDVERLRSEYIAVQTVKQILPAVARYLQLENIAAACEAVKTAQEARKAALQLRSAAYAAAADAAAYAAAAAADAAADADVWSVTIAIAEGAFAIGNQAQPVEMQIIKDRADAIKREAVNV